MTLDKSSTFESKDIENRAIKLQNQTQNGFR